MPANMCRKIKTNKIHREISKPREIYSICIHYKILSKCDLCPKVANI